MYCSNCGNELPDDSMFCNKCGSKLNKDNRSSYKQKINLLDKKHKMFIAIGVLVVAAILSTVIVLKNPVGKFKSAVKESKYTEASKIYDEKIKGNSSEEGKAVELLKTEIENLKKKFVESKLEYNAVISQLDGIQNLGLVTGEVTSAKNEVNRLNESRIAYKKGIEFLNNKNYKNALQELMKVIKEDDNYNKAQELFNNSIKDYKAAVLSEIEANAGKGDYDTALSLVSEALAVIPNESDISAKKASYEKLNEEKKAAERKKKIEEAKTNQQILVDKTGIIVQSSEYKALYPDMLQVIIRNNSDKTVKNMKVSILGFDSNGLPLKIKAQFSFSGSAFEFIGNGDNVNITPGATFGKDVGWNLDENHGIKTVLACVKEVEYYDGSKWSNSYYDYWIEEYKEKPLH